MSDVCLVTKTWRSGAGWFAQSLVAALANADLTVSFIAPAAEPAAREPAHPRVKRIVVSRELTQGGQLRRLMSSLRRVGGTIAAVARERRRTRTFIFTMPDPLPFTLPVLAGLRLSGARVILVVHDALPHAWRFGPAFRWLEKGALRLAYRLPSALVALTPKLKDDLVNAFSIAAKRVEVIPHGPFPLPDVAPLPGDGRLLQFGTMRRNKAVLDVIEAVTIVRREDPGLSLILAGEPHTLERDYWSLCMEAVARDPAGFDVRDGFIPDSALPELLNQVNAFVVAYRDFNSASGVATLAAFNQRPAIGTDAGALSELYDLGLSGERIATPISAETVANAIRAFRRRDPAEWRERAAVATDKIAAALSWEAIALEYRRVARAVA